MRLRLIGLAVALAAVALAVLLVVARSPEDVRRAVDDAGAWAPVAFVVAATLLTCAFFPFPIMAASAGLLFGVTAGTALSITGGTLGAFVAFLVARYIARQGAEDLAGDRLARVRAFVARRGFVAVLYARIFPGVPRDLANYVFGVTRVGFAAYATATLLGIAPRAYAYTALGGTLGDLTSTQSIVAVSVLVAMGALGLALVALERRRA
ncbi:MAG: TVP38/TMEM64 family protein [Solirubrobacteraceae bacterium MAG38_C4-C5]|nr:TVP38/TMEM64 family protein [Candidatus Siliceabacter maunaloa]